MNKSFNSKTNHDSTAVCNVVSLYKKNNRVISEEIKKNVINEKTLNLFLNGIRYAEFTCLNEYTQELALGFLYSEQIINSVSDINKMEFKEDNSALYIEVKKGLDQKHFNSVRKVTTTSAGGLFHAGNADSKPPVNNPFKVSIETIWKIMGEFTEKSDLFIKIGGVHSALFFHGETVLFIEDIGRHNCIDKITGILLTKNKIRLLSEGIIFLSGRISTEIISKLIRQKVPVVVSRTTPTAAAVKIAEKNNITIAGYVRGEKAVIYSCKEKILY